MSAAGLYQSVRCRFSLQSIRIKQKTCLRSKQDIFVRNNYCTLLTFLASLDFLRAAAFLEITPS